MKQSFFGIERRGLRAATAVLIATVVAIATATTSVTAQVDPSAKSAKTAQSAPAPANQPKIQVLDPVYDFGTLLSGPAVHHIFKVKNAGGGELIIDHVQTSCGCTAAEPSKKRLKPGEQAEIAVTLDTRFQKGHSERTITVFSNDPRTPQLAMTIKGQLAVEVETRPEEVFFSKVWLGTEETRQVTVTYLGKGKDFKVDKISNSSPNIKVTQAALKDGKPGVILSVTKLKSMPVGPFDDSIEIVTNRQPILVHVSGRVVGDIAVEPAQVSFGIVPHGQGGLRILRLTNSGARAVRISEVSSTNHSVAAKVDPVTPGKEYKITVELRKGTPDGQLRGRLSIKTDDPKEPLVTVPFYGIVGAFEG